MNDPMPPESLPPESAPLSTAVPGSVNPRSTSSDRHKYDELIAVVVALFGIGGILFWVLGRANPFTGSSPWGGAISGELKPSDHSGNLNANGTGLNGATAKPNANAGMNLGQALKPTANDSLNAKEIAAGIAAGGAAAGIAAVEDDQKANRTQSPTPAVSASAPPVAPAPPNVASSAAPNTATPAIQTTPEIVEKDVLPAATAPRQFSDVPESSPIAAYVDALSSRGVLDQFNDGTLNPNEPISRGEFANLVSKAFGKPRIKAEMPFSDVPADSSSKAAVVEATRTGFMSGFTDGSFKPDLKIPRYQMQVAIVSGTQLKPDGDPMQVLGKFADNQAIPKWATAKVGTAVSAGILPAKNLTSLKPEQAATRGEAVIMLHESLVKEGKLPVVK
jgi:S-layer homology domain